MPTTFDDITKVLNDEESIADSFKEILLSHLKELQDKTGMSHKELKEYIERIMVM